MEIEDILAVERIIPLLGRIKEIIPLKRRGSDRSFFRLFFEDGRSIIAIKYGEERPENSLYVDIGNFLLEIGVPVPKIISAHKERRLILVEDLGDTDLFSKRSEPWLLRRPLYEESLRAILKLHTYDLERFKKAKIKVSEPFGPELYFWERDYFLKNFVYDFLKIDIEGNFLRELNMEFERLTQFLTSCRISLIHRDFQSQNVMIKDGRVYLIDFQGLRIGNPLYDLGSMVYDPYSPLSDEERGELIRYYHGSNDLGLSWEDFYLNLKVASVQRLMQALGAYSFLSQKKGLKEYVGFIPSALKNLETLLREIEWIKRLTDLICECEQRYFERVKSENGSN